jgi:3-oxoacyl-[acyl-carrier protein] reductase
LGVDARVLVFDVTDRDAARTVLERDIETFGAYFGVVCNAGIIRDAAFPAMMDAEWDEVIDTGVNGFYNVLKPVVMPMVRRRLPGRIVTIASISGLVGNRGQVNYSAAKGAVIAATKALAMELAKRRITVNCVAPGLIDTEMLDPDLLNEIIKHVPMGRPGSAEEVAGAVSYLLSEDAGYVTRQVLSVNGGLI